MKILCVHAHPDDFEFVAAGTYLLFREKYGASLRMRVVVCTDGAAGHHQLSPEATRQRRAVEQEQAAELGGFEATFLKDSNGQYFSEATLQMQSGFRPALWAAIREFQPDYLIVPPLPREGTAGVHPDHWEVAEAIRKIAYLLNVPHAFPQHHPGSEPAVFFRLPVIVTAYDAYLQGATSYDWAVDITSTLPKVAKLLWCHRSQVAEWIPWVSGGVWPSPRDSAHWEEILAGLLHQRSRQLGLSPERAFEVFQLTSWGRVVTLAEVQQEWPSLLISDARR